MVRRGAELELPTPAFFRAALLPVSYPGTVGVQQL